MNSKLQQIEAYVFDLFHQDSSGHDFHHMKRVANMAKKIAETEKANPFVVEAAGWLHDIGDKKLFSNPEAEKQKLHQFLVSLELSEQLIHEIDMAIRDVSFSKGRQPETIEGKIVQDADRMDAIGAIGIARTFAYGGSIGSLIHSDDETKGTSVQHFYDKLLLLKDLMHTSTAKSIAGQRHRVMQSFLDQFYDEWNTY
ncbi:HD domain-containing protein [Aquibacillus rhizosphaerae]|uniref:HD domain-containing protein n=1 Tax=Aquibacillus rhizosphaerae TaxID=3051431 RepID=A0ABT7L1N6_9BACI|nr:HD domain-containing protein [Aquibacillus sp. LR5S19]MDL4839729.1 HD domain-containing protein [Aquibacillus sp. LR5S19]